MCARAASDTGYDICGGIWLCAAGIRGLVYVALLLVLILVFAIARNPSLRSPHCTRRITVFVAGSGCISLRVPLLLTLSLAPFAHLPSVVQSAEAVVQEKQGCDRWRFRLSLGLTRFRTAHPVIGSLFSAILPNGRRPRHLADLPCRSRTTPMQQTGLTTRYVAIG